MSEPVISLRCLAGRPCPEDVATHARSASKLTPTAIEHLPEVLDATVTGPMTQSLATALTQFSIRYEIAEADLGRTMRAARFVVREASALDLAASDFAEDCSVLYPESRELVALLASRYEAYKKQLRAQLYLAALEEHGAVLSDVTWRIDLVATTSHAPKLAMPVALLTLRYRDGGAEQRLTLQVPGEAMKKLRDVVDAILK